MANCAIFILVILYKFAKLSSTKLISLLIHQNFSPTKLPSFTVLNTICEKILKWENLTIHLFFHHLFLFRISFTCTCTCSSVISILPSNWFRLTHWPCFSPPKLITYSIFYLSVSFCCPPNATTVRMEENASSATAPAEAYSFNPSLLNFANA